MPEIKKKERNCASSKKKLLTSITNSFLLSEDP